MKIETASRLWFEGFTDQTEFQKRVIQIILSDDKFLVFYIGRIDDLNWKYRYYLFGSRSYRPGTMKGAAINKKWYALLELTGNPSWCIVMWNKESCKYIKKVPKLKKNGEPRINPNWKKLQKKNEKDS